MKISSPKWKICVVSHSPDLPNYGGLSNALLYGDEVLWIPTEIPVLLLSQMFPHIELNSSFFQHGRPIEHRLESYRDYIAKLTNLSLPISVPPSLLPSQDDFTIPPDLPDLKSLTLSFLDTLDSWYTRIQKYEEGRDEYIIKQMQSVQASIIDQDSPFSLKALPHWESHNAAQRLMSALSRVLLPDMSSLTLEEVLELRERVKGELDPMRAELLRLTEDLRQMVKNEQSIEELTIEAENLIKTRVEPVVREAAKHAEEVSKTRWKKLLKSITKAVGFAGLGFLEPTFTKEALKQSVEAASDVVGALGKTKAATATARFVLELRCNLQKKDNIGVA